METKKQKSTKIQEVALEGLIIFIPFATGAFLYGVLDWNNLLQYPILILSVIVTHLLIKRNKK